jgi:hypothetical protein
VSYSSTLPNSSCEVNKIDAFFGDEKADFVWQTTINVSHMLLIGLQFFFVFDVFELLVKLDLVAGFGVTFRDVGIDIEKLVRLWLWRRDARFLFFDRLIQIASYIRSRPTVSIKPACSAPRISPALRESSNRVGQSYSRCLIP